LDRLAEVCGAARSSVDFLAEHPDTFYVDRDDRAVLMLLALDGHALGDNYLNCPIMIPGDRSRTARDGRSDVRDGRDDGRDSRDAGHGVRGAHDGPVDGFGGGAGQVGNNHDTYRDGSLLADRARDERRYYGDGGREKRPIQGEHIRQHLGGQSAGEPSARVPSPAREAAPHRASSPPTHRSVEPPPPTHRPVEPPPPSHRPVEPPPSTHRPVEPPPPPPPHPASPTEQSPAYTKAVPGGRSQEVDPSCRAAAGKCANRPLSAGSPAVIGRVNKRSASQHQPPAKQESSLSDEVCVVNVEHEAQAPMPCVSLIDDNEISEVADKHQPKRPGGQLVKMQQQGVLGGASGPWRIELKDGKDLKMVPGPDGSVVIEGTGAVQYGMFTSG
jgi:hypothetical protein